MALLSDPAIILPAAALVLGATAFLYTREQARRAAATRTRIIRWGTIGMVAGVVIGLGAWKVLPTNPESPAMLITYFVSFVVGGGLGLFSLVIFGAAVSVLPDDAGGVK